VRSGIVSGCNVYRQGFYSIPHCPHRLNWPKFRRSGHPVRIDFPRFFSLVDEFDEGDISNISRNSSEWTKMDPKSETTPETTVFADTLEELGSIEIFGNILEQ
jgi:hypothetical protein